VSAAPCVSVVIIVHNGAAFLAEAIESVLAQTFFDYELLIVDDGSTDASRDIALAYRDRSPEMLVLQHPGGANRGMSASRNLGLATARGEYVAFLDADDVWLPAKLAEQLAVFRAHPEVGLVYGRARIWRSWNSAGKDFVYDLGVAPDQVHAPPALFHQMLRNVCQTPTTSGSMMLAAAMRRVGGFEDAFRSMFEDQVFFAKLLLRAPAYVSGATWFNYRQHAQSASAISAAGGGDDRARLAYLAWLSDYLCSEGGCEEARKEVRAAAEELRRSMLKRWVRRAAERLVAWSRFR
jgi:glycosyltransferase involved in cell wall biosynthesis